MLIPVFQYFRLLSQVLECSLRTRENRLCRPALSFAARDETRRANRGIPDLSGGWGGGGPTGRPALMSQLRRKRQVADARAVGTLHCRHHRQPAEIIPLVSPVTSLDKTRLRPHHSAWADSQLLCTMTSSIITGFRSHIASSSRSRRPAVVVLCSTRASFDDNQHYLTVDTDHIYLSWPNL